MSRASDILALCQPGASITAADVCAALSITPVQANKAIQGNVARKRMRRTGSWCGVARYIATPLGARIAEDLGTEATHIHAIRTQPKSVWDYAKRLKNT